MNSRVLNSIRFENHLQTLRSLGLPIKGFAVFDTAGSCLWSDRKQRVDDQRMLDALQFLQDQADRLETRGRFVFGDLDGVGQVFATHVDDAVDGRLLMFVMIMKAKNRLGDDGINRVELAALAVSANMLSEYQLHRELSTKSRELAYRSEELETAFRSDQATREPLYGFESLRQIVRDTTRFLGVGLAALLLPSKDLEIYDLDDELSIAGAPNLLARLKSAALDRVRELDDVVLANSLHDRIRLGLNADAHCRLMILPVRLSNGEIAGGLILANNEDRGAFGAADSRQGEVMARKIAKNLEANFDGLTGLENSHSFAWAVGQSLMQACSRGLKHAILHVDIDRTGIVNEVSGREAGDALIRLVAGILADSVRAHDSVARIGGDEFGILLETCALESAATLAEKIGRRVESTNFDWKGTMHPLSVCIGVAPITANSESVSSILDAVSVARDVAREQGRNRVQVYEQEDIDLLRRRGEFHWVGEVRAALSADRFELHAQPIMPVAGHAPMPFFEVLVRMRTDQSGLVAPVRFMPAAEEYQLMPEIDRWVLGKVVDRLLAISEQCDKPPLRLSVNLSAQSISDEPFRVYAREQLQRLGPLAEFLCFELSESAVVANTDDALEFMQMARGFGCSFALDDFGRGLSSFGCLQRIAVDYLKIDGSFVVHADADGASAAMVKAINQAGQALGVQTIAEFAENEAVVGRLSEIGVDFAQGYHFGRPRRLAEVVESLTPPRFAVNG